MTCTHVLGIIIINSIMIRSKVYAGQLNKQE
jgi:hypothetical protein